MEGLSQKGALPSTHSSASPADRPGAAREHRSAGPREKRPPPATTTTARRHAVHHTGDPSQFKPPNLAAPFTQGQFARAGSSESTRLPPCCEPAITESVGDRLRVAALGHMGGAESGPRRQRRRRRSTATDPRLEQPLRSRNRSAPTPVVRPPAVASLVRLKPDSKSPVTLLLPGVSERVTPTTRHTRMLRCD